MPKGRGRRGQSAAGCPLTPSEVVGGGDMAQDILMSTETGFRPLGTTEGASSCQASCPLPTHLQLSHQQGREASAWPQTAPVNLQWIRPVPNALHSHLCLLLLGIAPGYRQGGLKVHKNTTSYKERQNKVKQHRYPKGKKVPKWSSWWSNCSGKLIQGRALIWGLLLPYQGDSSVPRWAQCHHKGKFPWPKEPPAQRGVRELPLAPQLWHGLESHCCQ